MNSRIQGSAFPTNTTTGHLWMEQNGGEQWRCLVDAVPPVHNVKVAVVWREVG
jgi:hypothetical protein